MNILLSSRFVTSFKFLCLVLIASLNADEEIRVHLTTANPLQPIYIGKFLTKQAAVDPAYLVQLESLLVYDFNYNGTTQAAGRSLEKEELLSAAHFQPQAWRKIGIPFAIKCQVSGKQLTAYLYNAQNESAKSFDSITLTGDLDHDRRLIHRLADSIHKVLFNTDGIAHTRILFAYQAKNPLPNGKEWISEIWECDWDGANAKQVTNEQNYCVSPVLFPHSSNFLYVSYKTGQPKIYLSSLKGGRGKKIIDLRGNQLLPAVSAQRNKMAFICDAGGRTDLFIQSLNMENGEMGKPVQLYSYPRSTQASPTFSPDGSKIAFVSDKDGGMRIFMIPTTPQGKRAAAEMISKKNRENSCPNWSPDGTKLAYSAKTNGIRQIWIYDVGTKEEWQLTSGEGNKENPVWAPDSKHIIFNSTDRDASELYVVNLNQPEALKITRGPGKKHYPSWGSR